MYPSINRRFRWTHMYKTRSSAHIHVNKTNIAGFRSTKFDKTEDHLKDSQTDIPVVCRNTRQSNALRFAHNSSKRSGLLFYPTISTSGQLSAIMKRKQLRKRASISEFEIESSMFEIKSNCGHNLVLGKYDVDSKPDLANNFLPEFLRKSYTRLDFRSG